VLSGALAALRQNAQSLQQARAVLAAAERMQLPLTQARSVALILRIAPDVPDAAKLKEQGRAQLQRYLGAIPEEARAAVRARSDLKEAQEMFE